MMAYKAIRQMVAMSHSTRKPAEIARTYYSERVHHVSAVRTGIQSLNGYEFFAVMTAEMMCRVDHIYLTDQHIQARWNELDNCAHDFFHEKLIAHELDNTQAIEGIHSSWQQTAKAVEAAQHPQKKAVPLEKMAHIYLDLQRNTGSPRQASEIRDLYNFIMHDDQSADIQLEGLLFREGDVIISDPGQSQPTHRAVSGEYVESYMKQWLRLANDSCIPSLIRAVMCHFIFEYIHPFYDGNGRTGRYLLAMQLRNTLSMPAALSVSSAISRHKNQYYKAFEVAEHPLNCAELTMFVHTLLEFIDEELQELQHKLDENFFAYEMVKIMPVSKLVKLFMAQELYGYRSERGMSIGEISERLGMNRNRVASELNALINDDVMEQISNSSPADDAVVWGADETLRDFMHTRKLVKIQGSGQRASVFRFEKRGNA